MKVSINLLSIDRYDTLCRVVETALANTGYDDWELLVWDNGSTDSKVIDFLQGLDPAYLRIYEDNLGIARALNQLQARSVGDYVYQMDNDILLPPKWMARHIEAHQGVPFAGVATIFCVQQLPPIEKIGDISVHLTETPFGNSFIGRDLIDAIGYRIEEWGIYGQDDKDLAVRANLAGFQNFYLGNLRADHLINDKGQNTPYRKMKDDAQTEHFRKYMHVFGEYACGDRPLYIPAPELI